MEHPVLYTIYVPFKSHIRLISTDTDFEVIFPDNIQHYLTLFYYIAKVPIVVTPCIIDQFMLRSNQNTSQLALMCNIFVLVTADTDFEVMLRFFSISQHKNCAA